MKQHIHRYILKALAFALAVLLPFALWLGWMAAQPEYYGTTIAASLRYKARLLEETESPRILFAGGSSVPYGIVCAQVKDGFDIEAVNIGAVVYLGMPIYLSLLRQYARKGDTVVLMLEPVMLQDTDVDYSLVWQALGHDRRLWKSLPMEYLPGLFSTALDFYRHKQEMALLYPENADLQNYCYFGPMGDAVEPRGSILEQKYLVGDPLVFDSEAISAKRLRQINRFCLAMKLRGVRVVYAFTPEDALAIVSPEEDIRAYQQRVIDGLACPVILSLEDAIYPGELFYNSNHHLTSEGAAINTARVIDALRPYLG